MPTKTPKPVTEFCETCDGPNSRFKWLGISRLSRIPDAGWPSRESCRQAVTTEEKAAGVKLVAEYREMEQQAIDNDVSAARARIRNPEYDAFEAERLREKIRSMSEEKFYGAHSRLNELREEAAKLVRPIFERLVVEFDNALQASALSREEELTQMGIPIYSDGLNSAGYPQRDFAIHADPIVTAWQCRRECVRHSALNIGSETSIGAVQYLLCTDEQKPPFQWLV